MSPTLAPVNASAQARLAATVDLPTPPLPLLIAMTCLTPGIKFSLAWACWPAPACSSAIMPLFLRHLASHRPDQESYRLQHHNKRCTRGKKMGWLAQRV